MKPYLLPFYTFLVTETVVTERRKTKQEICLSRYARNQEGSG